MPWIVVDLVERRRAGLLDHDEGGAWRLGTDDADLASLWAQWQRFGIERLVTAGQLAGVHTDGGTVTPLARTTAEDIRRALQPLWTLVDETLREADQIVGNLCRNPEGQGGGQFTACGDAADGGQTAEEAPRGAWGSIEGAPEHHAPAPPMPRSPGEIQEWLTNPSAYEQPVLDLPRDIPQDDPRRAVPPEQRRQVADVTNQAWQDVSLGRKPVPGGDYTVAKLATVIHPTILENLRPPKIYVGNDPLLEFAAGDEVLGMTANKTHDVRTDRTPEQLASMAADIAKDFPEASMEDLNRPVGSMSFRWHAGPEVVWHELGHLIDLEFGNGAMTEVAGDHAPRGKALIDWETMASLREGAVDEWSAAAELGKQWFKDRFGREPKEDEPWHDMVDLAVNAIAPSAYALVSNQEWWAEAVQRYVHSEKGRAWLRQHTPKTFRAIDALLSGRLLKRQRREAEVPAARAWVPGGGVEPGEGLHAAAIRETWEETGLAVALKGWIGDFEEDGQTVRYYVARVLSRVPDGRVHRDGDGSGGSARVQAMDAQSAGLEGLDRLALAMAR